MTSGTRWWSVTITSRPRVVAAAISVWLVVPQSTVTMTAAPLASAASRAASDRPWPSSSRLGTYGHRVHAEPAKGEGHDRQAGQAVGIEVAEDLDPLAGVPCLPQALGAGDRRRAVGPDRAGHPAGRRTRRRDPPRSRRHDAPAIRRAGTRSPPARPRRPGLPEQRPPPGTSSGSGPRPWRSGCHRPLHQGLPAAGVDGLRRPSDEPAGRGPRQDDRAGGLRTAASQRAACSRRRSTNRSRTRSRSAARG